MMGWMGRVQVLAALLLMAGCGALLPATTPMVQRAAPGLPGARAKWSEIVFEGESFTITPRQRAVIDEAVIELQNTPGAVITIVGRMDQPGSPDDILRLAQRRTDQVRDTILFRGNIPADRVVSLRVTTPPHSGARASSRVVDIAVSLPNNS